VGPKDVETLEALVARHQTIGINVGLVSPQAVEAQLPLLNLSDVAAVAYEPDSGYGSPPQTTRALAQRAADLGVDVRIQTPAMNIYLDNQGQITGVQTPTGDIHTRTVVDCVGPWARKFTQQVGLTFPVVPIVEHVVVVERPVDWAEPHPVVSDLVNLCYFRADASTPYTRIGNSDPQYHPKFALAEADDYQGQLFPGICEELHQKLLHRCPALKSAPVAETYSGMWGVTPDYQPILDHIDAVPGLYCAVGFSGHGYKLSPIIGDLMSRLILGKMDRGVELLKLFRFSRFQEGALIKSPLSYSLAKGLR